MKLLALFLVAGCWHSEPAKPREPVQPVAAKPAVRARVITLRYSGMSYVMDTPERQRESARLEIEGSELVRQIKALGHTVELEFDNSVGDDVVVEDRALGGGLGRIELLHLARGEVGKIVESIRLTDESASSSARPPAR